MAASVTGVTNPVVFTATTLPDTGRQLVPAGGAGQVAPVGSIRFRGREIAGLPSYRIARLGLGYVPENRDIFPSLTVRQNLLLGQKDASESPAA